MFIKVETRNMSIKWQQVPLDRCRHTDRRTPRFKNSCMTNASAHLKDAQFDQFSCIYTITET